MQQQAPVRQRSHVRDGAGRRSRWHALAVDFTGDIRYGVRRAAHAPGFAAISILTLALGIGSAPAVFSVVDGVLLRPLPYPDPDRILRLYQVGSGGNRMNVSEPNFADWKAETRSFRAMAQIAQASAPVSTGGERIMAPGVSVSREFFEVMGVQPALGRAFVDDEQHVGGRHAVIVSHRFWQARLGAAPLAALTLRIGDEVHDVVGFGAVLVLTLATVVVASYLPARRATRLAPLTALRADDA